ncbi:hypothetical protein TIFTF001_010169 [Ficus carica]|uniref:Uncharacterized protein n=1 Tax=Ficus carica TaxID=3494 RepID=A0AA87ZXP1_FICCA|nr:hypothetical protein TIFTF001_010169 [Ficus carica]
MQQRKSASGRPSGTDGSDFSYRMVVDSRYQKVAKGKSRLYALIFVQGIIQIIGALYTFLWTSWEEGPNRVAISSVAIGFVSLLLGELGRRRSRVSFLKLYLVGSSIAIFLSIACVAKADLALEDIKIPSNWQPRKFEFIEASRVLLVEMKNAAVNPSIAVISQLKLPDLGFASAVLENKQYFCHY